MKQKTIPVIVVGAMLMGVTAWMTYPSVPKRSSESSAFRFLHCPECEREQTYSLSMIDKSCLYCEKRLVATEESIKRPGGAPRQFGRMFMILYAELLALMAACWIVSRNWPGQDEVDYLYMNCEKCRQKIRCREEKIGLIAICRRCKHCFHYPEEGGVRRRLK
jgi:ribosomal protein S27E